MVAGIAACPSQLSTSVPTEARIGLGSNQRLTPTGQATIAVISSYFGGYEPFQPGATAVVGQTADAFVFTDHTSLPVAEGTRLVTLPPDPVGPAIQSRLPKLCPHLFLQGFDWVIYLDNRARLRHRPEVLIHKIGRQHPDRPAGRYLFRHRERDCAWDEAAKCFRSGHMTSQQFDRVAALFGEAGFPRNHGLYENPLMIQRMGSAETDRLNEAWYASLTSHTRRDQVMLPFLLWQQGVPFRVVERDKKKFIDWPVISGRDRRAFRAEASRTVA